SGPAGRTGICQAGVLRCATGCGRTRFDCTLCLPDSWTGDRERHRQAGIGIAVGFPAKVAVAKALVRRVIQEKIPFRWVSADVVYGFAEGWRSGLGRAGVF
ncbi:transposase, partial [Streptomyces alboverticillatus]|uniref:transposase n=1 Tax=Streptomyces alboverticillatus TaxID=173770 RepID=UPI0011812D08